ncbi:J domain-containing protein [Oceanicaulis sp. MMSF_3324]|uniref:J domain-containing protein n=1 Tax=Oceanicaulis sp. MMSF_3324 TaxID=3046702 RepID=UPI00273FC3BA|nr:J domain-containing protein [Oceanicaulis sp. MMSF_3324]
MSEPHEAIVKAYKVFGLEGDEDFSVVRDRFRELIKDVHPDTSQDNDPKTVAKLQRMLKAYEVLRRFAPRRHDITITPEEARKGGIRTIKIHDREAMIRIPVAVKNGTVVVPIGDPLWRVHIKVQDVMVNADLNQQGEAELKRLAEMKKKFEDTKANEAEEDADAHTNLLKAFCDRFVKASPAARFAKWVRGGSNAA